MAITGKTEFDRARTSHEAILRLWATHGRDAGKTSDLLRDRLVGRVGKAELGSDRAGALAEVGHLNALRPQRVRQTFGLLPSVRVVPEVAYQDARRHSVWQGCRRQTGFRIGLFGGESRMLLRRGGRPAQERSNPDHARAGPLLRLGRPFRARAPQCGDSASAVASEAAGLRSSCSSGAGILRKPSESGATRWPNDLRAHDFQHGRQLRLQPGHLSSLSKRIAPSKDSPEVRQSILIMLAGVIRRRRRRLHSWRRDGAIAPPRCPAQHRSMPSRSTVAKTVQNREQLRPQLGAP